MIQPLLPDDLVIFTTSHWRYLQEVGRAGRRQDRRATFGRVVNIGDELVCVIWDSTGRTTTHFIHHIERRDNHA